MIVVHPSRIDSNPNEIIEKVRVLPQLFTKMLCGKATELEMIGLADLYLSHNIPVLRLSEELISLVPKVDMSELNCWSRYGSHGKAVFSSPIAGQLGTPGAVLIAAPQGDTCDISQFDEYITPLHYHPEVVHLTAVTHGQGVFLIAGGKKQKQYLVKVPVRKGDLVLIPANVIHTFFTNKNAFQVVSFTSKLIPTHSPDFLVLANTDDIRNRSFINYIDYCS